MDISNQNTRELVRLLSAQDARIKSLETALVDQQNIVPKAVKNRHIDGIIIETGLATNRPDGSTHTKAYFATDSGVLSIWDGTQWLDTTLT